MPNTVHKSDHEEDRIVHGKTDKEDTSDQTSNNQKTASGSKGNTLYVSNIHPRIAEPHLQKLFGACGQVVRIHFVRKQNSRKTGVSFVYAFVEYQSEASARIAIEKIHGKKLLGKLLFVRFANRSDPSVIISRISAHDSNSEARGSSVLEEERLLKRQQGEVQRRIETLKKALAQRTAQKEK